MRDRNIARFPTLVRLAPFKFEARLARSGKQHPCRFPGSLVTWRSRPQSKRSLSWDRLLLLGIIWSYLVTYLICLQSFFSLRLNRTPTLFFSSSYLLLVLLFFFSFFSIFFIFFFN